MSKRLNKYIGVGLGLYLGSIFIGGPSVAHALTGGVLGGKTPHGTLNCSQLERLWEKAGGSPSTARMAAAIAMAESGGQQDPPSNASSNYNGKSDIGYWQINSGIYPGLATTNPIGNARAAIQISQDGTNWSPWVTYQNNAEAGLC